MHLNKIMLDNGLRLIVATLPSVPSATVTVWVKTGSRFEEEKVAGISHFLEHIVFKGSRKNPSAKAISEKIDAIGAEVNAGTSKEWTNFYIKARAGVVDKAFAILSDMVLYPLIKPVDIEREKGVICEEIAMYEDTPLFKIPQLFEEVVFKGSTLSRDIAGSIQTVKRVKKDDFERYRERYYYPENMLVTVSGGVKEKEVIKLCKAHFSGLKSEGGKPMDAKDKLVQQKPALLVKYKASDQAHLILGFKGSGYGHQRRYAEGVLGAIMGGGMSSRMFMEIREKRGFAYAVKTSSEHMIDNGYLATYAGIQLKTINEAIKVMLDQYYQLRDKKLPITKKELKKAKEYIKGHLALSLEDTKYINDFVGWDELYLGKLRTPQEAYRAVDAVSVDEVYAVARDFFVPKRLNLAMIGPFKEKKGFEKLLR